MRFLTAGESHGKGLVGIVEGVPLGLDLDFAKIADQLSRRRRFYGRSGRMEIEADEVEFLSGLRGGITTGSPISFLIKNSDYREKIFHSLANVEPITKPRPGHADYAGMAKYGLTDARIIAERASGRETATRTVIGAIARQMLDKLSISTSSHVVRIGTIWSKISYYAGTSERKLIDNSLADRSAVRCISEDESNQMVCLIDKMRDEGDTLGGEIEIVVRGVPVGIGSHVHYDRRLDYKISAMLMSIPSVKGISIGDKNISSYLGSNAADVISMQKGKPTRPLNSNGGIEGGMTNGADIVVTLFVKPVPTMKKPIETIDYVSGSQASAHYERSDVCVVPAISVVAENLISYVIACAILEETGADTMEQLCAQLSQVGVN